MLAKVKLLLPDVFDTTVFDSSVVKINDPFELVPENLVPLGTVKTPPVLLATIFKVISGELDFALFGT